MTGSDQGRGDEHWLDALRGAEDADDRPGRNPRWLPKSRAGASAAILALAVMAGFWIWAFSPLAPSGHPDVLYNVVFTHDAEDICHRAVATVGEMPGAAEATGPEDRATQISAATLVFDDMVTELRARATEVPGADADLLDAWLADWETYLEDRRAYAAILAGGSDPAFTVTARDGEAVTGYIDIFAEVNSMPSCATPEDV